MEIKSLMPHFPARASDEGLRGSETRELIGMSETEPRQRTGSVGEQ